MSPWRRPARLLAPVLLLATLSTGMLAQTAGKKAIGLDDPEFARLVKEWTSLRGGSASITSPEMITSGRSLPRAAAPARNSSVGRTR